MMILTAAGELLLLFLHLFSLIFLEDNMEEEKSNSYGWFVIILVGLYVLINWTIIMVITIKIMCAKWKQHKIDKEI